MLLRPLLLVWNKFLFEYHVLSFLPPKTHLACSLSEATQILAPRGAKKARRLDPVVREHIISMPSGEHVSTGLTIRNKASHKAKLLGKYFAQLGRLFRPGRTVHIMLDATRIGGEETLMVAIWCPRTRVAGWLPPQAGAS